MRHVSVIALTVAALAVAVPTSGSAWNEPGGFQDLLWGAPEAALKNTYPANNPLACRDDWVEGTRKCPAAVEIGGEWMDAGYTFRENRLVTVYLSFRAEQYAMLEGAFLERYGTPTKREILRYTRALGGTVEGASLSWFGTSVMISLRQYSRNITRGEAFLAVRAEAERLGAELREQQHRGAEDLGPRKP